jgi:peptidoglycan/LPS O-acetylase OafA/YrhL
MTTPPPPAEDRLLELDALRGLAALVILLHHGLHLLPAGDVQRVAEAATDLFAATPLRVVEAGRPAVLFFFVLSGFVLTRALLAGTAPVNLLVFALQRSIRILLPVAVALALSVSLRLVVFDPEAAEAAPGHHLYTWFLDPTPLRLAAELALLRNDFNVVLWSLAHEWRLTLLLPLVLLFRGRSALLLALAALAAASSVLLGVNENEVFLPRDPLLGLAATLYFALGVGTGAALALAGPLPRLRRDQMLAAAIGAVAGFSFSSDLASYAGSVLLILLASQAGALRHALRRRPLVALGRISFSLYLVHVPVLLAVWHLAQPLVPGAATALGMLAALAAAPLFWFTVEEPARRVARWIARRSPAARSRPA